jgi:hypothetical protein
MYGPSRVSTQDQSSGAEIPTYSVALFSQMVSPTPARTVGTAARNRISIGDARARHCHPPAIMADDLANRLNAWYIHGARNEAMLGIGGKNRSSDNTTPAQIRQIEEMLKASIPASAKWLETPMDALVHAMSRRAPKLTKSLGHIYNEVIHKRQGQPSKNADYGAQLASIIIDWGRKNPGSPFRLIKQEYATEPVGKDNIQKQNVQRFREEFVIPYTALFEKIKQDGQVAPHKEDEEDTSANGMAQDGQGAQHKEDTSVDDMAQDGQGAQHEEDTSVDTFMLHALEAWKTESEEFIKNGLIKDIAVLEFVNAFGGWVDAAINTAINCGNPNKARLFIIYKNIEAMHTASDSIKENTNTSFSNKLVDYLVDGWNLATKAVEMSNKACPKMVRVPTVREILNNIPIAKE